MKTDVKELTDEQSKELINALKTRFERNMIRHPNEIWAKIGARLEAHPNKLWSLHQMELTDGEPDVVGYDKDSDQYIFCDCSAESPKGRRSICYDHKALESRKENKPGNSAMQMAASMGIKLLTEKQYKELQQLGKFDTKTSNWILTPTEIRALGGAIFADYRYGQVFVYHNGAGSYYSARGFRGVLKI